MKIKNITYTNESIETSIYCQGEYDAGVTEVNFIGKDFRGVADGSLHPFFLDENGEISEIEVLVKRSEWGINNRLTPPKNAKKAEVQCELEECGPIDMGREKYLTNNNQEFLYIQLEESEKKESLEIGENIIIDVTPKNKLSGVWILNLHKETD